MILFLIMLAVMIAAARFFTTRPLITKAFSRWDNNPTTGTPDGPRPSHCIRASGRP
jgi:hypothetical protein